MVGREVELGTDHERRHAAVLTGLGVADEHELARAIREGSFDVREEELMEGLRETVRCKLEVANPAYLETYEGGVEREAT
jgi:hypothetical protein